MTGSPTAAAKRYRNLLIASTREALTRERAIRRSGAPNGLADYPVPLTSAEIDLMVQRYEEKWLRSQSVQKADGPTPIKPVQSPRAAERAYERALRHRVLNPLFRQLRAGLAEAYGAAQLIAALDGMPPPNLGTIPEDLAEEHLAKLAGYHRDKLIQTFRTALGIDIRPVLQEAAIRPVLAERMRDNVRLITSIPQRVNDLLHDSIRDTFEGQPFDQQALARVLQNGYRTVGYQTRRIARDQTTKTIGQLTEARHRQIGIQEYIWRTSQDERVRPTHASLDGTPQRWDRPPAVGHPGWDIQCRCVALPVIAGTRWAPARPTPKPSRQPATTKPKAPKPPGAKSLAPAEVRRRLVAQGGSLEKDYRLAVAEREALVNEYRAMSAAYKTLGVSTPARAAQRADMVAKYAEIEAKKKEIVAVDRRRRALARKLRRAYLEHQQPPHAISWQMSYVSPAVTNPANIQARISAAMEDYQRLVAQWPNTPRKLQFEVVPGRGGFRASCGQGANHITVTVSPGTTKRTIIHELGHALENADDKIMERAARHVYQRTQGDPLESLRTLTGLNYKPNEVTRKDAFFHPYVGRHYEAPSPSFRGQTVKNPHHPTGPRLNGTEVTSMGLEWLYAFPVEIAMKDPRLFDHVYRELIRLRRAATMATVP